jgi:hypothetical protein
MSRTVIVILIYQRHKPIESIKIKRFWSAGDCGVML